MAAAIEDYGHEVWWDAHLVGGDDFRDVIEDRISRVDAVIVLWTESSIKKLWVKAEAMLGLERNNLVPVRYSSDLTPPMGFEHLHAEYLGDWTGEKRAPEIDRLVVRVDGLKSARDRERLANLVDPKLKAKVQNSNILRVVMDSALPGGMRLSRLILGALSTTVVLWAILYLVNLVLGDEAHVVNAGQLLLLFAAILIARALDQLVLAAKGRSSDRFFDRAFAFACQMCVLVALALELAFIIFSAANGGQPHVNNDTFQDTVAMVVVLLVASYSVRGLLTLGRSLSGRV
jgi:hypothetical protein